MPRPKTGKKARRKKRPSGDWQVQNFAAVLKLPERLAIYLRQLLQLTLPEWDFCLDKLRQYAVWQEQIAAANREAVRLAAVRAAGEEPDLADFNLPATIPPPAKPAYREWAESKGPGKGDRHFAAPCAELKLVQRRILDRFLSQTPIHPCRHGNQRGSSILTNARVHAGFAQAAWNVDLMDAFPSVYRSRVRAVLKKPFNYCLRMLRGVEFSDLDTAQMLEAVVDLLVLHDRLPQGPPTSPRVLDLVCLQMDGDIYELLTKAGTPFQEYRLTVYVDDLTVSTNGEAVPEEIQAAVKRLIRQHGFKPHVRADKTRAMGKGTAIQPEITGLVLNADGRLTIGRTKVDRFKARLAGCLKMARWDKQARGEVAGVIGFLRQVYGERLPARIKKLVLEAERRLKGQKKSKAESPAAKPPS